MPHSHRKLPAKKIQQKAEVIDIPTEKKRIAVLMQKLKDAFEKDPKAAEKAAVILTSWISKKK